MTDNITLKENPELEQPVVEPGDHWITFSNSKTWSLRLKGDGTVEFNKEAYPNNTPNDFALEFMRILEDCFTVKFYKKENDTKQD